MPRKLDQQSPYHELSIVAYTAYSVLLRNKQSQTVLKKITRITLSLGVRSTRTEISQWNKSHSMYEPKILKKNVFVHRGITNYNF